MKKSLLDLMNEETNYLFRTKQYEKATESLLDYKQKALLLSDYLLYSTVLSKLIICYAVLKENEEETNTIDSLLLFLDSINDNKSQEIIASMYLNCVSGLCNNKDYTRALSCLNKAYNLISELDDAKIEYYAEYYDELGRYYKSLKNYPKAVNIYIEAIDLFTKLDSNKSIFVAKNYINLVLTEIYIKSFPVDKIKQHILKAYKILNEHVDINFTNIPYYTEVLRELKYFDFTDEAEELKEKIDIYNKNKLKNKATS